MQRYLSTAISKMEKDEKKTQEDWIIPTILQFHPWAHGPVLFEEVQQCERNRELAQQDVRQGKVGDEYVPGGQLHLGYAGDRPQIYSFITYLLSKKGNQYCHIAKYSKHNEEEIENEKKS